MSDLDKKLEVTCRTCGGSPGNHKPSMFDPTGVANPAHRVEGYVIPREQDVHVHVCSCGQMATTRFMTGQEWYDRFEKELIELSRSIYKIDDSDPNFWNSYVNNGDAVESAKKAAGIE